MDYEEYDEYFEPSELDERMREIAETLKESVKAEIKQELETLRAENERLREYERMAHENDIRLAAELNKLDQERTGLRKSVRNARLRELFGDYITTAWCVQRIYTKKPKCDKCNAEREIEYKSPRGKTMYEPCECSDAEIHYEVKPTELISVERTDRWGETKYNRTYFTAGAIWADGSVIENSIERTNDVYNDEPLEELKPYYAMRYIFLDESKCKEFCEYLNSKEKENG